MSMIRLELSNRDYNTIVEALLESALDWEHAADEQGTRPTGPSWPGWTGNSTAIGVSPGAGGPYWSACKNRRRQNHADGAGL